MPIEVLMPALSPTMTEGKLAKWLKKEGDTISSGEPLAEIETDKATMEFEAVDEGVLGRILVPAGTEGVAVNQPIAVILQDGENKSALDSFKGAAAKAALPAEAKPADEQRAEKVAKSERFISTRPSPQPSTPPRPEPEAGETKPMTVREALREAMATEMRRDPTVFLMGEEVGQYQGAYKISQGLLEEFGPQRVIDTPITEHGFAGLGVGAAFGNLRPIVEFMTFNFSMQAMDHIINSAAKTLYMSGGQMGCPIVFRGPNGAAARVAAQHSQNYGPWFAHIPGLKVVAPYSGADAKGLLKAAIRDPNPIVFLEHELLYGRTFDVPVSEDFVLPIGKAKVERVGKDVTIVAFSIAVDTALRAAEVLAGQGIDAEVINLRSLRPLDVETIVASVKKTNRIVSVEESWPVCGIGSEIAAICMEHAFDHLDAPLVRVTAEDVPLPYAANLEKLALPQPDHVVAAVKSVCYAD